MRSRAWLRAAVLSCLLLPSLPAAADIPPPPDSPETKRVPVTIELDWGVFADRVSRRHVVVAGDTLRSLAAKYLGDKEKWKAIADANPALAANPDRIKVGDALWVPPTRYAETPPPSQPGSGETAPPGPWYDAFWMEMHGNTNWTLDAPATPDTIPAKYAAGGSFRLLPHDIAVKFRADLDGKRVGRPHEASAHALTAWVRGDGLVNKEDPTVRCVSRFRLTGVKDRAVVTETERLRYDAAGALVTRVWDVPQPSHEYVKPPGEPPLTAATPVPAPPGMEAPPTPPGAPDPSGTDAPPTPTFAPPSAVPLPPPLTAAPTPAATPPATPPPPQPSALAAPTGSAPIPSSKEGGSGGAKPPIPPLVLVVASLVALALIGVVVALRRGATKAIAAMPPPPPTSSAAPPPSAPAPGAPAGTTEFPPGSPPPPA